MEKEIKFDIRYIGGDADQNKLSLYDASTSILGFAKAIAISANTLVTKGKVRIKGGNVPNVKTYLYPSKKGSFIEIVSIVFQEPAVKAIGVSLITSAFWAMLEYSWKIATGQEASSENDTVNKIFNDNELLDLELSAALENPIQQVHRPILHSSDMKIQIHRPRVGKIIEFDFTTKEYVCSTMDAGIREDIVGNVTKYNIISGYGRLYVDELEKTLPFNIDRSLISIVEEGIIKGSLFKSSNEDYNAGKILVTARIINDKQNQVRRYTVLGAKNIMDEDNESIIW